MHLVPIAFAFNFIFFVFLVRFITVFASPIRDNIIFVYFFFFVINLRYFLSMRMFQSVLFETIVIQYFYLHFYFCHKIESKRIYLIAYRAEDSQ